MLLDRCENSDLVKCVLLLFLAEAVHFNLKNIRNLLESTDILPSLGRILDCPRVS